MRERLDALIPAALGTQLQSPLYIVIWFVGIVCLVTASVTFAQVAGTVTAADAHTLIEHGNIGLIALIVLTLLVPVILGAMWLTRQIVKIGAEQLVGQQKAFTGEISAQRQERESHEKSEREERDTRWQAVLTSVLHLQEVALAQTHAQDRMATELGNLITELRQRPCLHHVHQEQEGVVSGAG
jgi:hypothetical protein